MTSQDWIKSLSEDEFRRLLTLYYEKEGIVANEGEVVEQLDSVETEKMYKAYINGDIK